MMRVTMLALAVVTILRPLPAAGWRGINERIAARGAKQ